MIYRSKYRPSVRKSSAEIPFKQIVERVSMEDAVTVYGCGAPDRHGNILCPFHSDKHPSMRIYPGGRGWYCFSCGMGGDVVTFVEKLFGLSPVEAAKKLMSDFGMSEEKPKEDWRRAKADRVEAAEREESAKWELTLLLREIHFLHTPRLGEHEWAAEYGKILALEDYLECEVKENLELYRR